MFSSSSESVYEKSGRDISKDVIFYLELNIWSSLFIMKMASVAVSYHLGVDHLAA